MRRELDCRWSYTDAMQIDEHGEAIVADLIPPWTQPSGWILDKLISADAAIALPTVLAEGAWCLTLAASMKLQNSAKTTICGSSLPRAAKFFSCQKR